MPDPTFADTRPERLAEAEATLSAAVVAYAMQASGARIAPANLSKLRHREPRRRRSGKALSGTASAAEPGDALAAYNPSQKGYQELRDELARLRAKLADRRAPSAGGTDVEDRNGGSAGPFDPRALRPRRSERPERRAFYDARVASAVAAFQKSKGLAADGALTAATSEALFGDPNFRREAAIHGQHGDVALAAARHGAVANRNQRRRLHARM